MLSLNRAIQPMIEGCTIAWNNKTERLNKVFYNQIVSSYKIFNKDDFDKGNVTF